GDYFMYLDADMRFADSQFIKKMLFPLKEDTQIAGTFVQFKVNKKQPPLTRTLSYDEFQRDPIFAFFTHGISSILKEKREKYWLCLCTKEKIPPQGLMIYRRSLIKEYIKDKRQLIDNDIPAILVEEGHTKFAFVPYTGVEHLLVRNLKELAKKRIRNLERTYFPNESERKFKWINWKKDWPKVGIWLLYTHSPLMFLIAIAKSIKSKDFCFLNEPALNIVSTYAIIYAVLKNKWKK
ncbi:MAG TPA: hypothetical protein VJK51_00880, partial [Candidatus Nanoarchaeia archaeon]|nr:hypothetical protein [Candidatus Nanoarchaeia archaeon]